MNIMLIILILILLAKFKEINVYFDFVYLENKQNKIITFKNKNYLEKYIKVHFALDDFMFWNKIFPYDHEVT